MSENHSTRERAVFYGRKSNEDDGASVKQQREWGRAACERERLDLVREFADEAVAGHDTARRTDFHAMLAFCQEQARLRRPVCVIACWHLNRFSRADSQETSWFIWEFRKAGVGRILTAQRWYDLGRKEDRALLNLEQDFTNQQYVIDLAQAVARGKLDAAKEGRWNGGTAPLGYRLVYEETVNRKGKRVRVPRLVIDEETAPLVREMFRAYAAGETSLYQLARELNARGVKPTKATAWCPTTVRARLVNEVYLGTLTWNKTDQGKFFGVVEMEVKARQGVRASRRPCSRRPKADHIRRENNHEAIVDRETFDAVQRRLVENRKGKNRAGRADYALRGLLRCGVCGESMVGKRKDWGNRELEYRCGTYNVRGPGCGCTAKTVSERPLVVCIARKLQAELLNPEKLAEVRQEMLVALEQERPDAREEARARKDLVALEQKLSQASERFLTEEDEAAAAFHRTTFQQLLDRKKALDAHLLDLETRKVRAPDVDALLARALGYMHQLDEAMRRMNGSELRAVLRDLLDCVEVYFRTETVNGREATHFVRGFVFVKAGVLPAVSTAACRGPASDEPPCRPYTSSGPR